MILPGDNVAVVGCENDVPRTGDVEEVVSSNDSGDDDNIGGLDDCGDFAVIDRCEEGASIKKLQLSPFLLQFAHTGCLPSHY